MPLVHVYRFHRTPLERGYHFYILFGFLFVSIAYTLYVMCFMYAVYMYG